MSASSSEVVIAINNVASITEENSASTEEISDGSKTVDSSVNEMLKVAVGTAPRILAMWGLLFITLF